MLIYFSVWSGQDTAENTPLQHCPGFQCTSATHCIPNGKRCDFEVDCLDAEDELGCLDVFLSNKPLRLNSTLKTTTPANVVTHNKTLLQSKLENESDITLSSENIVIDETDLNCLSGKTRKGLGNCTQRSNEDTGIEKEHSSNLIKNTGKQNKTNTVENMTSDINSSRKQVLVHSKNVTLKSDISQTYKEINSAEFFDPNTTSQISSVESVESVNHTLIYEHHTHLMNQSFPNFEIAGHNTSINTKVISDNKINSASDNTNHISLVVNNITYPVQNDSITMEPVTETLYRKNKTINVHKECGNTGEELTNRNLLNLQNSTDYVDHTTTFKYNSDIYSEPEITSLASVTNAYQNETVATDTTVTENISAYTVITDEYFSKGLDKNLSFGTTLRPDQKDLLEPEVFTANNITSAVSSGTEETRPSTIKTYQPITDSPEKILDIEENTTSPTNEKVNTLFTCKW